MPQVSLHKTIIVCASQIQIRIQILTQRERERVALESNLNFKATLAATTALCLLLLFMELNFMCHQFYCTSVNLNESCNERNQV